MQAITAKPKANYLRRKLYKSLNDRIAYALEHCPEYQATGDENQCPAYRQLVPQIIALHTYVGHLSKLN